MVCVAHLIVQKMKRRRTWTNHSHHASPLRLDGVMVYGFALIERAPIKPVPLSDFG